MYICISVFASLSDLKMFIEGERMIKSIIRLFFARADYSLCFVFALTYNIPTHVQKM